MAPPKGFVPWNKGKKNIYSKEVLESNRKKHLNTYEERYGPERAKKIKKSISIKLSQRRLSDEHKRKIGIKSKERLKGKTFEELYGEEKAKEMKNKISNNNWAKKMKGNFPKEIIEKKRNNNLGEKNPMYGIRGEKHHSWLGGLKLLPYDKNFNKWFKEGIRQRDNYRCLKCGIFNEDHKRLFNNQQLQVHHINYEKFTTSKENCCTLCCRCNGEVNFNRKHWIKFFHSLLSERYGYKYNDK